jgi:hypothetical protein
MVDHQPADQPDETHDDPDCEQLIGDQPAVPICARTDDVPDVPLDR